MVEDHWTDGYGWSLRAPVTDEKGRVGFVSGLKHTPLYEEHIALGARMVPFAGWEMPVQYTGIMDEHRAVRASAGIFDVCHMAEFRIFGSKAKDGLQVLLTNDLDDIDAFGSAQYTLMCNEAGGIVDDLIIYHTGDLEYLVISNAGNHDAVRASLEDGLPKGVELVDESHRTGLIAVQGPAAVGIVCSLADEAWGVPERFHISEAVLAGAAVLVARTGYTGEDGVEIICRADDAVGLWRALLSFPEVVPCGLGARDTLRLEMGYPLHGSDIDTETDPYSARLGWTVALDSKNAFVGREALFALKDRGPQSKLAGLLLDKGVPRHGYDVLHEGDVVGNVASGTFSPTLKRGIATAYVPTEFAVPGSVLGVDIRGRIAEARVVRMPFVTDTSLSRTTSA